MKEEYACPLDFSELQDIAETLEDRVSYARTARDYLLASLYESWVDSIKNCEVSVEEARQMLQASKLPQTLNYKKVC